MHELHRLYIGLQSDKFKKVHIADGESHHPDSLETICPIRWLTTLSVVIWNNLPADTRVMLVLQVVNVSWAYMPSYCFTYLSAYIDKRSLQGPLVHEMVPWA